MAMTETITRAANNIYTKKSNFLKCLAKDLNEATLFKQNDTCCVFDNPKKIRKKNTETKINKT